MGFFSKGLKNEFERAVVNEPSVFEPLTFYCIMILDLVLIRCMSLIYFLRGLEKFPQMGNITCFELNEKFNPMYTGGLFHCYMLDESISHFRGIRSILSLKFNF